MRIYFTCETNKNEVAINTLVFTLPNGTQIKVDREETGYDFDENGLFMTWNDCYLWSINDCNVFGFEGKHLKGSYEVAEFKRLIQDATYTFELEDDTDTGYKVAISELTIEV